MYASTIKLDLGNSKTELCGLGSKYGTTKSPFLDFNLNNNLERRECNSYTPFYDLLFSSMKYKKINFGEIGIYENASMKMWRNYFPNANLYGWDCKPGSADEPRYKVVDFVEKAKRDKLNNVFYDYMDVRGEQSISEALGKTKCKFDVLIDDSDHEFWSQIKVIRSAPMYLNPGSFLIIEDVNYTVIPEYSFARYIEEISRYGHDVYYDSILKVNTKHFKETTKHPNSCLLVLTRSNFI